MLKKLSSLFSKRKWNYALLLLIVCAEPARSEIQNQDEPLLSGAILLSNSGEYKNSQKIIEALIKKYGNEQNLLEISALNLKSLGDFQRALDTYRELITNTPDSGLYWFQVGVISLELGQDSEAEKSFLKTLELKFNLEATHYFLGVIALRKGDIPAEADAFQYFTQAEATSVPELRSIIQYQLAWLSLKNSEISSGLRWLEKSRELNRAMLETPNASKDDLSQAKQLESLLNAIAEPLDKSNWSASALIQSAYDSDMLKTAAEAGTAQLLLDYSLGYSSPLLREWTWQAHYLGSANLNFASSMKGAHLYSNTLNASLGKTRARFPFGLGLDANYNFQKQYENESTQGIYRPYLARVGLRPYVQFDIANHWIFTTDVGAIYVHEYAGLGSGQIFEARLAGVKAGKSRFFNPDFSFTFRRKFTQDLSQRSWGLLFEGLNYFYLHEQYIYLLRSNLQLFVFPQYFGVQRNDLLFEVEGSVTRPLNERYYIIARLLLAKNISNMNESYGYTRYFTSLGAGYSF